MQRSKKSIYIGSIIIALIIGIYIIYDNSQGVISKIFVSKDELTEQTNNIFASKQFGAVVLANMVKDEKDPEKAKKIVEESIQHVADDEKYKLYYNLAISYSNRRDYKNSIYFIDKALIYSPECYMCYNSRGLANMFLNNPKESLEDFNNGLKIKEEAIIYSNRAILYSEDLNEKDKAIADLKAAIHLDKHYNRAKFSLFDIYYLDKNIGEAKKTLELIKQTLDTSNPENYAILQMHEAIILLLENNLNGSLKIMEKVFKFLDTLEQKTLDSYHYQLIYTKMNSNINKLLLLKQYQSVLKYVKCLEKLERKYNYDPLKKDILIYKEELKKVNIK